MINFQNQLTRGIQSALDKTSIDDGKLRFTIDTGRLYLDNEDNRIEITDFITEYTEEEILATLAPLPKFYFAKDTHSIFVYSINDDDWVKCCDKVSYAETAKNASTAEYAKIATNASTANYCTNAGTATYATKITNEADIDFGDLDG